MAVDATVGQDAVREARAFMEQVDLTGFVVTKLDGDARGGAALSATQVTGRPVYFAGVGEKPADLEPFHPDRMASRILGMGDVLTLVEKAEKSMDEDRAREAAERVMRAEFTLEDFLTQLREVRKLGPLQDLLSMLPGGGQLASEVQVDDRQVGRAEAIISSMTLEERRNPAIISGSRRSRIARGSGTSVGDVNALLKQFDQTRKMMKQLTGGRGKLPKLPGLPKIGGL
jgi:signal recognition particle subunit SRP54